MSGSHQATITNTNGDVWHVSAYGSQHLFSVTGPEDEVLAEIKDRLVSERNFPANGEMVRRGPGRYSYVT